MSFSRHSVVQWQPASQKRLPVVPAASVAVLILLSYIYELVDVQEFAIAAAAALGLHATAALWRLGALVQGALVASLTIYTTPAYLLYVRFPEEVSEIRPELYPGRNALWAAHLFSSLSILGYAYIEIYLYPRTRSSRVLTREWKIASAKVLRPYLAMFVVMLAAYVALMSRDAAYDQLDKLKESSLNNIALSQSIPLAIALVAATYKSRHSLITLSAWLLMFAVVAFSVRSGDRSALLTIGIAVTLLVAGVSQDVSLQENARRRHRFLVVVGGCVLLLVALSAIRTARSSAVELGDVLAVEEVGRQFGDRRAFLEQDYRVPALALVVTIHRDDVSPARAATSDLLQSVPFVSRDPSLGETFARSVGGVEGQGFGFLILTSGFLYAGYAGIVLNWVYLLVFGRILSLFARGYSDRSSRIISAIIVGHMFSLVRSQYASIPLFLIGTLLPVVLTICFIDGQTVRLAWMSSRRASRAPKSELSWL